MLGSASQLRMWTCTVCGNEFIPSKSKRLKVCSQYCYTRFYYAGGKMPHRLSTEGQCLVEGCARERYVRGFCSSHYHRDLRYGSPFGGPLPRPQPAEKKCCGCSQTKPASDYFYRGKNDPHLRSMCKMCLRCGNRGITYDQFRAMWQDQAGRCGLCAYEIAESGCSIDHCHRTGRVRGLLCQSCNVWVGHVEGHRRYLAAALDYLRRPIIPAPAAPQAHGVCNVCGSGFQPGRRQTVMTCSSVCYSRYRTRGLLPGEMRWRYEKQAGLCAICGDAREMLDLRVDHCHASAAVRGLLCQQCNVHLHTPERVGVEQIQQALEDYLANL